MIKYTDENNFEFKLRDRHYIMQNGELTIDYCVYEDVEDGGAEIYELVRAYVLVALGQFKHEDLMETN